MFLDMFDPSNPEPNIFYRLLQTPDTLTDDDIKNADIEIDWTAVIFILGIVIFAVVLSWILAP